MPTILKNCLFNLCRVVKLVIYISTQINSCLNLLLTLVENSAKPYNRQTMNSLNKLLQNALLACSSLLSKLSCVCVQCPDLRDTSNNPMTDHDPSKHPPPRYNISLSNGSTLRLGIPSTRNVLPTNTAHLPLLLFTFTSLLPPVRTLPPKLHRSF